MSPLLTISAGFESIEMSPADVYSARYRAAAIHPNHQKSKSHFVVVGGPGGETVGGARVPEARRIRRLGAQVTLVKGELRGIASARLICVATGRDRRQNLLFALACDALGIPRA